MSEFFSSRLFGFTHFITPTLIRVIFIVGGSLIVLTSLGAIKSGFSADYGGQLLLLGGLLALAVGPVLWRVACEVVMLFFRMHEMLDKIESHLRDRADDPSNARPVRPVVFDAR
jgi:hypothetical protein